MNPLTVVVGEVAKRPELISLVVRLLRAVLRSDDPVEAARRAVLAAAAPRAAHKVADAVLRARAAKRRSRKA